MMDFEEWFKDHRYSDTPLCYGAAKDGFKAGQQSKQAEIDALNDKIQELWTELDDRQSKEYIIERCESIIQEILK